jgi:hypothetical protein
LGVFIFLLAGLLTIDTLWRALLPAALEGKTQPLSVDQVRFNPTVPI